jgi:hypothetical protein
MTLSSSRSDGSRDRLAQCTKDHLGDAWPPVTGGPPHFLVGCQPSLDGMGNSKLDLLRVGTFLGRVQDAPRGRRDYHTIPVLAVAWPNRSVRRMDLHPRNRRRLAAGTWNREMNRIRG